MTDERHPDTLLTRWEMAAALTDAGFRTAPATLAALAVRGGGAPFQKYGQRPLYRLGEALAWARGRLSTPPRPKRCGEPYAEQREAVP
jgi:hypothetical protein